jgi:hypothetical protein
MQQFILSEMIAKQKYYFSGFTKSPIGEIPNISTKKEDAQRYSQAAADLIRERLGYSWTIEPAPQQ